MSQPHLKRVATLPREMTVLKKSSCHCSAEWSKPPRKTQPFETIADKYLSSDVSVMFTWRKVCRWKNFENRSAFGKVRGTNV